MRKRIYNVITITVCICLILAATLFFHNYKVIFVNGDSMAPTLTDNQILLAKRRYKSIDYSDIVIFKSPDTSQESEILIKRVVALEGDTISVQNEKLYINGLEFSNYALHEENLCYTLKPNELFVLGDNAQGSTDSRAFGPVSRDMIIAVYRESL